VFHCVKNIQSGSLLFLEETALNAPKVHTLIHLQSIADHVLLESSPSLKDPVIVVLVLLEKLSQASTPPFVSIVPLESMVASYLSLEMIMNLFQFSSAQFCEMTILFYHERVVLQFSLIPTKQI
jgi:hypothetical protein